LEKRRTWISILVLLVTMTIAASAAESQPFALTIREYNLAGIKDRELVQTHREVERIFQKVGIAIRWEHGESDDPEAYNTESNSSDGRKEKLPIPNRISIRILSNRQTRFASRDLGTSLPFRTTGVQVTVFSDNVHQTSFELEISPEMLLGHVIAHEIGHVLLRSSHHSLGIMNAHWSRTDYYRMKCGGLDFTGADKATLQRAMGGQLVPDGNQSLQ
jgi:hypothetical protein